MPGEERTFPRQILHALSVGSYGFVRAWRALAWAFKSAAIFVVGVLLFFLIPFLIGMFILSTPRDEAYRNFHVALPLCQDGLSKGWTVLAESEPRKAKGIGGEWVDASNDEAYAVAKDPIWGKRLRCSLQRHVIPVVGDAADATKKPIDYYLGFWNIRKMANPIRSSRTAIRATNRSRPIFWKKPFPQKTLNPQSISSMC